ncbi:transposase, partial [Promicromonospora sp. NPDC050880]|uniref:transposase n=1 Tax=Promicromonospora sp. NPDC050880 TaxID=3364406 RepID=UPI0037A18BC4
MPSKYPQSFRDRAVRMVVERLEAEEGLSRFQAIKQVAPKLNISIESLRRWVEQAEIDTGTKPGVTSDAGEEIRRLKRENAELRRANEMADSTGQCNGCCEMGQTLISGGTGCRASMVIS